MAPPRRARRVRWGGVAGALALALAPTLSLGAQSECLVGWRVGGAEMPLGGVRCQDGDPACDVDGLADGACSFAVSLCLNIVDAAEPGCAAGNLAGVRVRGGAVAPVAAAAAALEYPVRSAVCTADVPVVVRLGGHARRNVVLRASARDTDTGRVDRDRLRLTCQRPNALVTGRATAVVVTTDFETGLLATVGVARPHRVGHPTTPIHSDAVVRTQGGRVFVVNRFIGDNLQVINPRGFSTALECSTGRGSNPHDVVVAGPHKAYVTRYDRPELWIVDPDAPASCAGFFRGAIDLAPYGDSDGLPEMDQMALVGNRLFVSIERLDRTRGFAPAGRSALVVIDTATDQVTGTVELSGANAFGETAGLAREPGTGKLVVAEAGNIFTVGDGGLERVDPQTLTAEGFFISEDDLGGNITDFVLLSPTKGYAVVIDRALHNILLAFDPSRRTVTRRLLVRDQFLPELALAPDGTLWVADRGLPAPGIRIFDPATDRQLTRQAIDVGLPPFAMGFLP